MAFRQVARVAGDLGPLRTLERLSIVKNKKGAR